MKKRKITTKAAPSPIATYSQGIGINNRLYVAGQGPLDVTTNTMPTTVEEQTEQVIKNISTILEEGGFCLDDVVKVNVYLADLKDFEKFDKAYRKYFEEPLPVRTTVGCELLDVLVEIDVIAEKPSDLA
ncbi:MAG: RidA family protein [Tissierellia bacterium]|nr:RidA family protein [Tissierellia bacterium]